MLLIVDDCQDARESLAEVFATFGYRCLLAGSGAEALRVLESAGETIELVFLDLAMPGMDGFDVARVIGRSKPVVIVSGVTGRRPPETAVGCLRKPASIDELLDYARWFCRRDRDTEARPRRSVSCIRACVAKKNVA
jgi:DNA-binding response OmpR family regulator